MNRGYIRRRSVMAGIYDPGDKLLWSPPNMAGATVINITESNRIFPGNSLSPTTDYILNMPATPITGDYGLVLSGGRNIQIIGGEIYRAFPSQGGMDAATRYGIYLLGNQTGTVHIEGMKIHGPGMGQCIYFGFEDNENTVQIQNCRLESMHPVWDQGVQAPGYPEGAPYSCHTDTIQSGSGPYNLRMYKVTMLSNGVCFQTQPKQYGAYATMGQWSYEKINMVKTVHANGLGSYALWADTSGSWWDEYHKDLYLSIQASGRDVYNSSWRGGNDWPGWNPGGGKGVTGEFINIGTTTDYAPSSAGIGYVSPGYV